MLHLSGDAAAGFTKRTTHRDNSIILHFPNLCESRNALTYPFAPSLRGKGVGVSRLSVIPSPEGAKNLAIQVGETLRFAQRNKSERA